MEPLTLAQYYVENPSELSDLPERIANKNKSNKFTKIGLEVQISRKIEIIASIENYLMAHWDDFDASNKDKDGITILAKGTLAYYLSDENNRELLIKLFKLCNAPH